MNGLYIKIRCLSFKLICRILYVSLNEFFYQKNVLKWVKRKKWNMKNNIIKMIAKYITCQSPYKYNDPNPKKNKNK